MIQLTSEQMLELNNHFISVLPNEGVCFVVNGELLFVDNIHDNPTEMFRVDPKVYAQVINTLQCVIHSHPPKADNGLDPRTPSPSDVNNQQKTGVPWGIVSMTRNTMSDILWYPSDPNMDLWGRPFIHGVYDCFEFIRSYYWQNHNVMLDKPLGHNWSAIEDPFISTHIRNAPFEEIPFEEIQKGDLLTFRKGTDVIAHFAVALSKDKMGHHAIHKYSGTERIRKYRPFIHKCYRLI